MTTMFDEIQLPLFQPTSTWAPPAFLPDLSDAKSIAVDTENRDPGLKKSGPGFIQNNGYIAGIGVATDTGFKAYLPIAHTGGGNLDPTIIRDWLRAQLGRTDRNYVFANAQYDLGWLRRIGVEVRGTIHDICIADTLIDEERHDGYSLEAVCRRWGLPGKDETLLRQAARDWGLQNPKADLWKLPANLVGPYGETDPLRTLQVHLKQLPVLRSQGLMDVYKLECEVTRVLFEMYWKGIRVDVDYATQLNARWLKEEQALYQKLRMGADDIWNNAVLARVCDKEGISYPRTKPTKNFPNGQPSITKEFMEQSQNPTLMEIRRIRAIQRTRSTYLEQNLIQNVYKGRIHPQYIQLHSEDGGCRTPRLSCKNPNAQQFPKRSTLFDAKALRKALIPEEGMLWAKQDFWSQEPTIQCHYALLENLPGAVEVAAQFEKGIKLATYVEQATGGALNYDQAKQVILARSYNQQPKGMSMTTGMPLDKCNEIIRRLRPARAVHQDPVGQRLLHRQETRLHQDTARAPATLQLLGSPVQVPQRRPAGLDTVHPGDRRAEVARLAA